MQQYKPAYTAIALFRNTAIDKTCAPNIWTCVTQKI
uniref:Uncharacterized protein n=1 Tax=Arundo donax TaxID=35708 RepID=A0A0A9H8B1_ARUDO